MSLKLDHITWLSWIETIPILEYFCGVKKHSATKEELLEYAQKFRLIKMSDLEERLNFLENKGLIHVFKTMVMVKWYY